jgi:hypothetical protein
MNRKIIQIAVSNCAEGEVKVTSALADDGTLWEGWYRCHHQTGKETKYVWEWEQIPGLPQNTINFTKVR